MQTLKCWLECGQLLTKDDAVWIIPGGSPGHVNEDGVQILDDDHEVPSDTDGAVPLHRDCWRAWVTPPEPETDPEPDPDPDDR